MLPAFAVPPPTCVMVTLCTLQCAGPDDMVMVPSPTETVAVAGGLATFALNVIMMVTAYLLARWFASGAKQRTAIAMECGLQNGTLAIAIAVLLFGGGLATVPATTYSLTMFVTALIYVALLRRRSSVAD